tara:strand:+ start:753 stop:1145 length:393 start_codon:yes stop_codon:yes gene_type:complete
LDNPVNISGQLLEDQVESYCVENNISYQRAKPGAHAIDFIIDTDDGKVFADCTNQNSVGSVEEKLPHKLWKYHNKYGYSNVCIIKGDHKISPTVLMHCQELARTKMFKLTFKSLEEFCNSLTQKEESYFG